MEERHAIAIPNETWVCEAQVRNTYPALYLTPLKEILSEADLQTCYTPAHQELKDVAEKWDVRKVLPLARRYGEEAQNVVDKAMLTERTGLKFEARERAISA
jgi:hypothetical protein